MVKKTIYSFILLLLITFPVISEEPALTKEGEPVTEAGFPLSSQNTSQDVKTRKRRLLIFYKDKRLRSPTAFEKTLLKQSLLETIINEEIFRKANEYTETSSVFSKKQKDQQCRDLGYDCWLSIKIKEKDNRLIIDVDSFDIHYRQYRLKNSTLERNMDIEFRDLVVILSSRFSQIISQSYQKPASIFLEPSSSKDSSLINPVIKPDPKEQGIIQISISGKPGTIISGLGKENIKLDEQGKTSLELKYPSTYTYKAEKKGYLPIKGGFLLGKDPINIKLQQKRPVRFNLDAGMRSLQYPYLAAGFNIIPDIIFLRLGLSSMLFGYYIGTDPENKRTGIHFVSEPLYFLHLKAGSYLPIKKMKIFKIYFAAGCIFNFLLSKDKKGLDPVVPASLEFNAGLEYRPFNNPVFFFEWAPLIYLLKDKALYDQIQRENSGDTNRDPIPAEFIHFFIGLRLRK